MSNPSSADKACINVQFIGGNEDCDLTRFAEIHIQDWSVAERIAQDMLDGEDPYEINDDFPQVFTIIDHEALRAQLG